MDDGRFVDAVELLAMDLEGIHEGCRRRRHTAAGRAPDPRRTGPAPAHRRPAHIGGERMGGAGNADPERIEQECLHGAAGRLWQVPVARAKPVFDDSVD